MSETLTIKEATHVAAESIEAGSVFLILPYEPAMN
jgi:hypothetical protein